MKKSINKTILLLAAVVFVAVASAFTYSKKEGGEIPTDGEQMRVLHFNGHRYVCYRFYNKSIWADRSFGYGGASIVHDPDCPCGKH